MEERELGNTDQNTVNSNTSDFVQFGGDLWKLLSKGSSKNQGFMKTTKVMNTPFGCTMQMETQQRNKDGSFSLSMSSIRMEGVQIVDDEKDENGVVISRKLVKMKGGELDELSGHEHFEDDLFGDD